MANNRKERIMQHLGLTSNIQFQNSTRNSDSSVPTPVPTPPPVTIQPTTKENRKQRILEHLSRSGANFNLSFLDAEQRKQQVQAHISKTRG